MNPVPKELVKDFNDTFGRTRNEWAELQTRAYERGRSDALADVERLQTALAAKLKETNG